MKTASKTLIGAFVVGATALLILAIAVFGSGRLFEGSSRYVLFFDGSISGLSVGSPVMFRGVPVGRVSEIRLTGDINDMVFQTPVYIELNKRKQEMAFIGVGFADDTKEYLDKLVANGLRAELATQSFVTGQLMIEMDFYPKSELPYQIDKASIYDGVFVIPTIQSKLDNIWQSFSKMPFETIANNILQISEGLKNVLSPGRIDPVVQHTDALLLQLRQVSDSIDKTLASIRNLSEPYAALARNADRQLTETLDQAKSTLREVNSVARQAGETTASARGVLSKNSPTVIELNQALREISEAARSLRIFANTLERNPESLLRGKAR